METIKLSKKEAYRKWIDLNTIATTANIPDDDAWYAMQRAHPKFKEAIMPLVNKRTEIEKEWLERDNTGKFTGKLKQELLFSDYEKAIEDLESGDDIEIEIYKIKLSTLRTATLPRVMNGMEVPVRIPAAMIANLQEWIIDDYEEVKEKEKKAKEQKPDIPPKK
jgi:hypothetical protein